MDKTAVAMIRISSFSEERVVGHVLKNMSKIVFMFLSLSHCDLDIFVTGKNIDRRCECRLEIPAIFCFYGSESSIVNEAIKTNSLF